MVRDLLTSEMTVQMTATAISGIPGESSPGEEKEAAKKEIQAMPRGDKSSYTSKQKRQAEKIEEGYKKRGTSENEAERRAWATVNKMTGGGKKRGSGRGKITRKGPARKGGRKGGGSASRKRK